MSIVAQKPLRQPLLRQYAADDLRADRALVPVRPHSCPPTGLDSCLNLRKSCCAAGCCSEIGSRAECRRRSSQCATRLPCAHLRRCLLSSRRRRKRLVTGAASSRKRAARSRGTGVRAKTRTPTTSACAWPDRCALLWRCQSAPPCSTRIKLLHTNQRSRTGVKRTGRFVLPMHVRTQ